MNRKLVARLRREEDGFTILSRTALEKLPALCDACGRADCKVRDTLIKVKTKGYGLTITHCKQYIAPLAFVDLTGLDKKGKQANTFRTGRTWYDRLHAGDIIALLDKNDDVIGYAVVESVFTGDQKTMLDGHARFNHMIKAKRYNKAKAAEELGKIIHKFYGHFLTEDKNLTAIYLKRIS